MTVKKERLIMKRMQKETKGKKSLAGKVKFELKNKLKN